MHPKHVNQTINENPKQQLSDINLDPKMTITLKYAPQRCTRSVNKKIRKPCQFSISTLNLGDGLHCRKKLTAFSGIVPYKTGIHI